MRLNCADIAREAVLNFVMSFALISVIFAAIYKVLPDAKLSWRDVLIGAVVTALLFNLGKFLIGLYLAHSAPSVELRGGGRSHVILTWVYYSAQIYLLGAEFTKIYASRRGTPAAVRAVA
jgi:membrane protein